MKVKVISIFKDKGAKEPHKLNEIIEVSKERYEVIKEYVELETSTTKKEKKEDKVGE